MVKNTMFLSFSKTVKTQGLAGDGKNSMLVG